MTKKLTKKGELILKTLQGMEGFCTAQDLHKRIPEIDLTTVYRNLEKLVTKNLVQKVALLNQEFVYEYSNHKHHHSFCESCARVEHISLSQKTLGTIPELKHFNPESIEVIIKGRCK